MKEKAKIIWKIISWIIVLTMLFFSLKIYNTNNFNEFIRAEYNSGLTKFQRDSQVKYSKANSYRIENTDFNDAMFYQKISVVPNTSYKVSCMIKTQDVVNEEQNTDAGAHICINQSIEKSDNIVGTSDWTKVEFLFNSKNRTEVEVGFRLGGNFGNSKGTAWFSDMKIETGTTDTSNTWNFLCLLFDNTKVDLNVNGQNKNFDLSLTLTDKEDMQNCIERFKSSIKELSKGKMQANFDIIEIEEPITTMSYDDENGYYVGPNDVKNVIDPYIKQGIYDHIFVAFRTGNINQKNEIPVNDWIGLGGMEYRNIGFSNIRLPNSDSSYIYKYDSRINIFPEEVYIHEFLHTLERNAEEYGYERPELHANERYGYQNQRLTGLRDWYADYMNKEIKSSSGAYVGLPEEIYRAKPTKTSNFTYSRELDYFKEPQNIIEELNGVYKKIVNLFKVIKLKDQQNQEI